MAEPITPFWFKQRQCKMEPREEGRVLKVTGPNLGEAYLQVQSEGGRWTAALRMTADGQAVAQTEAESSSEQAAWNAAFELYRQHVIA